jgi:hypothetical protein
METTSAVWGTWEKRQNNIKEVPLWSVWLAWKLLPSWFPFISLPTHRKLFTPSSWQFPRNCEYKCRWCTYVAFALKGPILGSEIKLCSFTHCIQIQWRHMICLAINFAILIQFRWILVCLIQVRKSLPFLVPRFDNFVSCIRWRCWDIFKKSTPAVHKALVYSGYWRCLDLWHSSLLTPAERLSKSLSVIWL